MAHVGVKVAYAFQSDIFLSFEPELCQLQITFHRQTLRRRQNEVSSYARNTKNAWVKRGEETYIILCFLQCVHRRAVESFERLQTDFWSLSGMLKPKTEIKSSSCFQISVAAYLSFTSDVIQYIVDRLFRRVFCDSTLHRDHGS